MAKRKPRRGEYPSLDAWLAADLAGTLGSRAPMEPSAQSLLQNAPGWDDDNPIQGDTLEATRPIMSRRGRAQTGAAGGEGLRTVQAGHRGARSVGAHC